MNKKGATGFVIILAIFFFFAGSIIYQLIKPDISVARGSDQMNCEAPLTWGDMFICLLLDIVVPYFIIGLLATTGALIIDGRIL